jgi:7,8-dihydropterin-6-yl-methyl-4-(beta-D-ribofuranosyl)aminobenzene 5'-phosphate synthase
VCAVPAAAADPVRLRVLFDNLPHDEGLTTGWGFACLIEGIGRTLMFDTGADGSVLLANMARLGIEAADVDAVFISHAHGDHTGGLAALLGRNPRVTLYLPASFPDELGRGAGRLGALVETVDGQPRRLFDGAYSTGEMGRDVREQALILDTEPGLVLVTGCAHPNVALMAEQAAGYLGRPIHLVLGGFHLQRGTEAEIREVIDRLRELGVRRVAPSHCTGDRARELMREAWGVNFVDSGLGAVVEIPAAGP